MAEEQGIVIVTAADLTANPTPVYHALMAMGFDANKAFAMHKQGFETLNDFALVTDKDFTAMATRVGSLTAPRGGAVLGVIHLKKLKALAA